MNPAQYLFNVFGVNQTSDIGGSKLYMDILNTNGWNITDCFYWTENDRLIIINTIEEAKNTYMFVETEDSIQYTCISSAMIFA